MTVCHLEYLKESIYEGLRSGGTCYHGGILCFSKYLQCLKPSLQSLVIFFINMCNYYDNNILWLLLMIFVDVYNKCTTWSKIDTISYYMNRKFQNYILYILYEEKKYTINILYFFCFGVVALYVQSFCLRNIKTTYQETFNIFTLLFILA